MAEASKASRIQSIDTLGPDDRTPPEEFSASSLSDEETSLLDRIIAAARRCERQVAVSDADGSWTYRELLGHAHAAAEQLTTAGARAGQVVCLDLPRARPLLAYVLGAWIAGCGYSVPPDDSSLEKVEKLARTVDAVVIVSTRGGKTAIRTSPSHRGRARDRGTAYVVVSSGTTGTPQPIEISTTAIGAYVDAVSRRLGFKPGWTGLLVSSLSVDIGLTILYPLLAMGGSVHIASAAAVWDGALLAHEIGGLRIDVAKFTPSHLSALLDQGFRGIPGSLLICGGEQLDWGLVKRVRSASPALHMVNHYGPAETAVGATTYEIPFGHVEVGLATVPVGVPLSGVQIMVTDQSGQAVAPGFVGELFIGGRQLSETLESKRLSEDRRWYATGDLVRLHPGGLLEHVGRVDDQVKISGYRVNRAEVEREIERAAGVGVRAAVMESGGRLLGFCMADRSLDLHAVRTALLVDHEAYEVPALRQIEHFPRTVSDKIDYGSLADLYAEQETSDDGLLRVWRETLGISTVDEQADFFVVGGYSLLALQMIGRIKREFGKTIDLGAFLRQPTLTQLRALEAQAAKPPSRIKSFAPPTGAPKIYWIHGANGVPDVFSDLATALGPGLDSLALSGRRWLGLWPLLPGSRLVHDYADVIATDIADRRPVILGGWSVGGVLAYLVAELLVSAGHEVSLLCTIDSFVPRASIGLDEQLELAVQGVDGHVDETLSGSIRDHLEAVQDVTLGQPSGYRVLQIRTPPRETGRQRLELGGKVLEIDGDHRSVLRSPGCALIAEAISERTAELPG